MNNFRTSPHSSHPPPAERVPGHRLATPPPHTTLVPQAEEGKTQVCPLFHSGYPLAGGGEGVGGGRVVRHRFNVIYLV
jgi:hypothetical protein